MTHARMLRAVLLVAMLLVVAALAVPASGQEPVLTETFDDPTLPGWEHTPEVEVVDGVLRVPALGFAFHGGLWSDLSLTVRARCSGHGDLTILYRWSDVGEYRVRLDGDSVTLQRTAAGLSADLAATPVAISPGEWVQLSVTVAGGEHAVTFDGQSLLAITDSDPLPAGGVGFRVEGEAAGEFDDLEVTAIGEAPLPVEVTPMPGTTPAPEASPAIEALPTPGVISPAEFTWVRTGGPPGGLGYDIRYNFDDPNIWYVTDNFAGVHVSTDNGLTWQPSNTGIPGQAGPTADALPIFCLTVDPHNPQIVWAGTDLTGHIYKSTDGGRTWVEKDEGVTIEYDALTFRGFTIDPRTSDIVYAMAETTKFGWGDQVFDPRGGVVYKTTNGGESWEVIWDGGMPSSLARYLWIDPRDPDVLYISTGIFDRGAVGQEDLETDPFGGLGIPKSTDGGQTWRILNEENGLGMLYIGSLFMHPENPDILLAAAGHVVPEVHYERLFAEGTISAGIYRTTDGGEHWTQVLASPPDLLLQAYSSVEMCPSDPNIAYAGSDMAVYRSGDAGQTWELVAGGEGGWGPPGVRAGWPIDMQCDPRDANRVFANNYSGGNFLSEDGGRTWRNASQGYTGAQVIHVGVDPFDPAKVYAAGRSGGWYSDDGGTSWHGLRDPGEDKAVAPGEWLAVALDASRVNHVLVGGDGILEWTDEESRWQTRIVPPPFGPTVSALVFAPSDPTTVYAGAGHHLTMISPAVGEIFAAGGGLAASHDGGTTWENITPEELTDAIIFDLAVDPTDLQIVYAASRIGLLRATDGGLHWTRVARLPEQQPVRSVAVSPADSRLVLAGVEAQGLHLSTDAGETWQHVAAGLEPNATVYDIVFDPTNPDVVYASDLTSGMYRSVDAGLTWFQINTGLTTRAVMGLSISSDGQHVYVASNGAGVFRLDLDGQPPRAALEASPTVRVGPVLPVGTPSEAQPTAPPEVVPVLCRGGGICPGAAALPVALLGLVWVSRRRS